MTLEAVKFDEKGQAYFDFEALEALTSFEFANEVKNRFERGYDYLISTNSEICYNVKFSDLDQSLFLDCTYFHRTKSVYVNYIGKSDIDEIVKVLGGEIKWQK